MGETFIQSRCELTLVPFSSYQGTTSKTLFIFSFQACAKPYLLEEYLADGVIFRCVCAFNEIYGDDGSKCAQLQERNTCVGGVCNCSPREFLKPNSDGTQCVPDCQSSLNMELSPDARGCRCKDHYALDALRARCICDYSGGFSTQADGSCRTVQFHPNCNIDTRYFNQTANICVASCESGFVDEVLNLCKDSCPFFRLSGSVTSPQFLCVPEDQCAYRTPAGIGQIVCSANKCDLKLDGTPLKFQEIFMGYVTCQAGCQSGNYEQRRSIAGDNEYWCVEVCYAGFVQTFISATMRFCTRAVKCENFIDTDGKCVDICPLYAQQETKACVKMCSQTQFLHQDIFCVDTCPENTFVYGGRCVTMCPAGYTADSDPKIASVNYRTCKLANTDAEQPEWPETQPEESKQQLSPGAVAGIVVGTIVFVAAGAVAAYFIIQEQRKRNIYRLRSKPMIQGQRQAFNYRVTRL